MNILFSYRDIKLNFKGNYNMSYIDNKLLSYLRRKVGKEIISYGIPLIVKEVHDKNSIVVYDEYEDEESALSMYDIFYPKKLNERIFAYSEVNYEYECESNEYRIDKFKLYEITGMSSIKCKNREIILYSSGDMVIPMTGAIRLITENNLHIYNIAKSFKLKLLDEKESINTIGGVK